MALSRNLKRLLLIRDEEWALVSRMFAFEFFQGASIALFFTSAVSLFLDRVPHPIAELPKVFILSAFLLWFFGIVYSKLEHRLTVSQITLVVLLFNAVSILFFRVFVFTSEPWWFYYVMLAWFNVTYLLNNLEFWGLASRLFDVRQSRRLFAIVSAGDIPAKFLGYAAAVVIIPLIGSQELLWIAAASSFVSLLFFHRLISLEAFQKELNQHHHAHQTPRAKDFYNLIAGNKLIRQVALISFFTLCCYVIVNFVFYGYVKEQFHQDKSLAGFIALFLAASRAITLIIKLLFTNRIADRLGIKGALLITPAVLAMFCILSFMPSIFHSQYAAFYLFGMMAIMTDVLRSAIQSPVLLSTMQPLPLHQRLQGHTIMKGIMDPFAFFVVGSLLLVLYRFNGSVNLLILSTVIMIFLVLWVIWIFSADKNYIQTLTAAIRNRLLNEREIVITDKESLEVLRKKISGGDAGEAVFVLHLLKDQPLENKSDLVLLALQHPASIVRNEAVKLLRDVPDATALLDQLLKEEQDAYVKAEAIKMLPTLNTVVDFTPFLSDNDPVIASAAISGILQSGNLLHQPDALKKLKQLASSQNTQDRKCALQTIGEVNDDSLQPILIPLLHDPDTEVINAAMLTACKLKSPLLADVLLKSFKGKNKSGVLRVLEACGRPATAAIVSFIRTNQQSEFSKKLIVLLGKIGGKEVQQCLDEMIDELPQHSDVLLHALHQTGFHVEQKQYPKYESLASSYLNEGVQIAFKIRFLKREEEDELVSDALYLELNALRDLLLEVFTLIYDPEKIQRAKAGLKMNTRESVPNALELIDQLVAKEFSQPFISLYEQSDIEHKCAELRSRFGEPYLTRQIIHNDILRDKSHDYFAWTKACVIYSTVKAKEQLDTALLEPLKYSSNALLRETAGYASGIDSQLMTQTGESLN